MKFVLLATFLVFWGQVSSSAVYKGQRGINDQVRQAIENFKAQMPCGFPDSDIPPLAPIKLDYAQYEIDHALATLLASVANLRVDGLNDFDIENINFSVLTLKMDYDFNFNEISAKSEYLLQLFIANLIKISGNGDLDFALQDLRLRGNLRFAVATSGMSLKEFNVIVSLGNVKSNISGLLGGGLLGNFANRVIETFLLYFIRDQEHLISHEISKLIMPIANEYLGQISLKDLIDMITNPKEPPVCIPPEFKTLLLQ